MRHLGVAELRAVVYKIERERQVETVDVEIETAVERIGEGRGIVGADVVMGDAHRGTHITRQGERI